LRKLATETDIHGKSVKEETSGACECLTGVFVTFKDFFIPFKKNQLG
jgi:hypothetical protein